MNELFSVENQLISVGNKTFVQGECISQNIESKELTYAFYLFHNSERIATKWYSASPHCRFMISEEGLYHIAAFIKVSDSQPIIIESSPIQYIANKCDDISLRPASLSIFGSCVSRDCIELDQANNITLCNYICRQSIVSAVSKPVPLNMDDVHLTSSFQKKQIDYDFNKKAFSLLNEKPSQFLLIDLVDERFQLAKYLDSYVTYSQILSDSGYMSAKPFYLVSKEKIAGGKRLRYMVENIPLEHFMDIFCDSILKIYSPEQIIIHRVYGAEHYIDSNRCVKSFDPNYRSFFRNMNMLYEYMYDYFHKKFNNRACNIDISKKYLCTEDHKWGLAPIHFQKEYYIAVINELSKYINANH